MNRSNHKQDSQEPRPDSTTWRIFRALAWFYDSGAAAEAGPTATAVYAKLLLHADAADWLAYPKLDTIAEAVGIARRTVIDALDRLQDQKRIERVSRGTAGRSTRYRLVLPADFAECGTPHTESTVEGAAHRTAGCGTPHPEGAAHRVTGCGTPHTNLSNNRSSKPTKNRRRAATAADPFAGSLPLSLDSDTFRQAWSDWTTYRREQRKALTASTIRKQLDKLATIGADAAVAAINHSIAQGYQGIYEPKGSNNGQQHRRSPDANRGTFNDPAENPLLAE